MVEIAISVAAKVAEYLVAPIAHPFRYLWNYRTNLDNLKKEVEKLKAERDSVQQRIKPGEEPLQNVKLWQDKVNKIIGEASEVDEDPEQANMQCCRVFSCSNLMKRHQRSKNAAGKLEDVLKLEQEFEAFTEVAYSPIPEQIGLQLSNEHMAFESRKSVLKKIIEALRNPDINVVGIYGMGGIGKTTLAKEVASEAKQGNLFDKIVFVEVSESPNIKELQKEIAESLGLPLNEESIPGRANRLCQGLKKMENILLMLDNIWEIIDFMQIGIPFGNNQKGLKLLLTTRSSDVLTKMNSQRNFSIQALEEADAWSLFKSIAGTCVEQLDLKSIAFDVAKECGGMPIAIVTIAKALKGKQKFAWGSALTKLRRPYSESFGEITKEAYKSIRLSYDYLEDDHMKKVFLICCRMGRTYDVSVKDLFKYGLGLGLFGRLGTIEEALCDVYTLVSKLKEASLLLDAPKSNKIPLDGQFPLDSERFAIHDVVCAVARSIAYEERCAFFLIGDDNPSWADKLTSDCTLTSITLHDIGKIPEDLVLACVPNLEFLYVKPKHSYSTIPDTFFTGMSKLQVLHLIEIDLRSLPSSLTCLVNLQALCLANCKLGDIDIVGGMEKLEILSLCGSDIEKLPKEMGELTKLRLLDLTHCFKLKVIPSGVISKLTKVEALYLGNTSTKWEVGGSNVSIDELKHLRRLNILEMHIPDAKMFKDLISSEPKRYKIFIGKQWEAWCWSLHCKTYRTLKLSLDTKEDWIISQLEGVEELELGEVVDAKILLDDLHRNGFLKLKNLIVQSNSHCSCIVSSGSNDVIPSLESLEVMEMIKLKKICNSPLGVESFLHLKTIRVSGCYELHNIFSFSVVTLLPHLKELEVYNCNKMEEIFAIEGQDDVNNSEKTHEIKFNKLLYLYLRDLPQLKSFCCKVKTASQFQSRMASEIVSAGELDNPSSLFNEKEVFFNFQTLTMMGIHHVERIWHNLRPTMSSCVQNLTKLDVFCCDNLKEFFSSSMVVSKKSREEERRNIISFPKLSFLRMRKLPKLIRLSSGYYIEFSLLKEFEIDNCPELKAFIFNEKMISHNQLADGNSFTKLKSLEIKGCNKLLAVFPSNICGRFMSLESLIIDRCDSLEGIFDLQGKDYEERHSTTATQSRQLSNDDVSFANLRQFKVSNCQSLKNLFVASNVVLHFPKLTSLELYKLPELRSLCSDGLKVEGPMLKRLKLCDCGIHDTDEEGKMQLCLLVEEAFPCLEELMLTTKELIMMWQCQVPKRPLHKLKILEVHYDESSSVQSLEIIQRFRNLEKLALFGGLYKEIVSYREDQIQEASLAKVKTLVLHNLEVLEYMWNQNSKSDLILQYLEVLRVSYCQSLIDLMPPSIASASFQNLTIMRVENCDSLENIVTSSVAKGLGKLKEMSILHCSKIKEVVGTQGNIIEDTIIFSNLKSLSLQHLPSLTSFCSACNFTLEFPSLEELDVHYCKNIEIFYQGYLTMPRLQYVTTDWDFHTLGGGTNVNTIIQQSHEKWVHIDSLNYANSSTIHFFK